MAPSRSQTRSPLVAKMHRLQKKLEDTPEGDRPHGSEMVATMAMVMDEQYQETTRHRHSMEGQMSDLRQSQHDDHKEVMVALQNGHGGKSLVGTIRSGCIKHWPYVLIGVLVSGGTLSELLNITSIFK